MPVLDRLACALGRRVEKPNEDLAVRITAKNDRKAIREIVTALRHPDKDIRNDCIKVLYEIGYRKPELIRTYWDDVSPFLTDRNNRMVWGAMITLSTIAGLVPDKVWRDRKIIMDLVNGGSVITQDAGVQALSLAASKKSFYRKGIMPFLLKFLTECRPKAVPQYCEKVLRAVSPGDVKKFVAILADRLSILTPPQAARVRKVIRAAEAS